MRTGYLYTFFLLIGLLIYPLPLEAKPGAVSQNGHPPHKPYEDYNVVLFFIDTLRADHLSCYGYKRKTSPNIDRLAGDSVVFEQNFSHAPYTLSSHMSIVTSLYPESHGVTSLHKYSLLPRVKTLTQILHMYGYKTAWFGPDYNLYLNPGPGFDDFGIFPINVSSGKEALSDWVNKNKNKRFFLNVHTYKIHSPYCPSQKYKKKFTKEKREGIPQTHEALAKATYEAVRKALSEQKGMVWDTLGEDFGLQLIAEGFAQREASSGNIALLKALFSDRNKEDRWNRISHFTYFNLANLKDPAANRYVQALYDANILEFDEEVVAPLIQALKDLKLYDRTIVIICSEHGEEFYEHGGYSHGTTLYRELIHVPLIIRVPWAKEGRRIKELSQAVDIMPTVLDLLEIPVPREAQGKSFAGLINGKRSAPVNDYVFAQHHGGCGSSIRSNEWYFILYDNGRKELFNLASDPKEQHDVYSRNLAVAKRLESELKRWEASLLSYKEKEYPRPFENDKTGRKRIKRMDYW